MEFITRDALIAAMNAWVVEKANPLRTRGQSHEKIVTEFNRSGKT
jgi:hypothetical protein